MESLMIERPIEEREQEDKLHIGLKNAVHVSETTRTGLVATVIAFFTWPFIWLFQKKGVPHGVVNARVRARNVRIINHNSAKPDIRWCPSGRYEVIKESIGDHDHGIYPPVGEGRIASSTPLPNGDKLCDVEFLATVNGRVSVNLQKILLEKPTVV